jgi:cytosine/adenosine deaminase-related metal-dependent hydrolase
VKTRPQILSARGILPRADSFLGTSGQAGLVVVDGRVRGLLEGSAAIERAATSLGAECLDLGEVILTPGFVNAHAHLELTSFCGEVAPGENFPEWVGGVLRERSQSTELDLQVGAQNGLLRLAETGTTTVGDIASSPATLGALGALGEDERIPRVRMFREVLDAWDPRRTEAAAHALSAPLAESDGLFEGYSPHAPYTVSSKLLAAIAEQQRIRPQHLTMHWAEMEEELVWMESGEGPFADVLGESPRRSGLDLLEDAGLLGPAMTLVHGNLATGAEIDRIAAAGSHLVHCPGTHLFFGREDFPLQSYLDRGVPLAIGTDSLASNEDLDLLREAKLLWARHPELSPETLFGMLTEAGASALGLAGCVGALEVGCWADWSAWSLEDGMPKSDHARVFLEALLSGGASYAPTPWRAS